MMNMLYEFVQSKQFTKEFDSLGLDDEQLRQLELEIMKDPKRFPVIPKTGRLRKMRWKFNNKGKRGGARVCYVDFEEQETIYLLLFYAKNEKEDLTDGEKRELKLYIDELEQELKAINSNRE